VLVLMADASFRNRIGFSAYILPFGLLSLEAVPIFREASCAAPAEREASQAESTTKSAGKEASESPDVGSVFSVLQEVLPGWLRRCRLSCCWRLPGRGPHGSQEEETRQAEPNRALRHLMAVKFWHGAYGSTIASMLLYYVTYVLGLAGWERTQVIVGAGLSAGTTEVLLNLVYMRVFGSGDSRQDKEGRVDRRLLYFVVGLRVLNALTTFILIGWATPSVSMLILWSVTSRIGLCSFSFWRVSAQCWLVDEDYIFGAKPGRRREAILFGALSMTQNFAGAVMASLTFLGLGIAGLRTENCEKSCQHLAFEAGGITSESSAVSDCVQLCFQAVITSQPESLRLYVRAVIGVAAPIFELLIAFHAFRYPIKGMRLRRLYAGVSAQRGDLEPELEGASLAAHSGKSKIVLQFGEQDAKTGRGGLDEILWRLAHTTEMVGRWPGSKSLSVLFDMSEAQSQSALGSALAEQAAPVTADENQASKSQAPGSPRSPHKASL
ncbi:unnamed protein product, partial [Polarella glacialis]